MSEITKEEIAIMIDVQSKTVVNLEKIANALKDIVDEQKALTVSQKALQLELISGVVKAKLDKMHSDIAFCKIIFGSLGIVVTIGYVLLKLFHMG